MQSLFGFVASSVPAPPGLASFLFLLVWLFFWSVGGCIVVHAGFPQWVLGLPVAIVIVWATITVTFAYVMASGRCDGAGIFFCVWIITACVLAGCYAGFSPKFRYKNRRLTTLAFTTGRRMILRLRHQLGARHGYGEASVPLTMLTVSVVSVGGRVFSFQVLSYDTVEFVVGHVERQLQIGPDSCCRLLCGDRFLAESDRFCDVGIVDGSLMTAVVCPRPTEPEPEPMLPAAFRNVEPIPRSHGLTLISCVYLFGWVFGEVFSAFTLETTTLCFVVKW